MRWFFAALTPLLFTLCLCQAAQAVLCTKCRGRVHDNQFSTCRECKGNTRSTTCQLCPVCSAELVRCERCYKQLTGEDSTHDPDKPRPLDLRKSGDYKFGDWMYRYAVSGLGTSGARVSGRLAYGGQEVARGELNDYYKTPWGFLYWVGDNVSDSGKRGWLSAPLTGVSRTGRLLTPQQPGSRIVKLSESDNGRELTLPVNTGILVTLPGNPTSGNQWKVSKTGGDAIEVVTRRPIFTAAPGRSGTTSRGGTYTFKVKTVRAGQAKLELAYGKSASAYGRPERTFRVTIVVR